MLTIGIQQQQWGRMLNRPGWVSLEGIGERAGKNRMNVNWGVGRRKSCGKRLWSKRRTIEVMAMEMAGMEPTNREVGSREGGSREVGSRLLADGGVQGGQGLTKMSSINTWINKASKWVVVLLVAGGMLWRHDEHALWFGIGSVLNGGFCMVLKYLINDNRPSSADGVKEDPGMPSSHAQGFAYLGCYVSLAFLSWQGTKLWTVLSTSGILLSVLYLSWLRISEGLHTFPQVLAGSTLGSATGAFWFWVWKAGAEAAVASSPSVKLLLYMSFIAACATCYFISFKDWQLGEP